MADQPSEDEETAVEGKIEPMLLTDEDGDTFKLFDWCEEAADVSESQVEPGEYACIEINGRCEVLIEKGDAPKVIDWLQRFFDLDVPKATQSS